MFANIMRRAAMAPAQNLFKPYSMLGSLQSASFAKYDRSKPHLNVGTIGKCKCS